MPNLINIKDRSPNQALIDRLEEMLEDAKSGEIRGIFYVVSFDDQDTNHSWVADGRISENPGYERLIGSIQKLLTEFSMWRLLEDKDSAVSQVLRNMFLEI